MAPAGRAVKHKKWTCGSRRFSDLHRGVPLMSRTLLAGCLEQLEDAGIVRSVARPRGRGREYHLTTAGEELRPLIECLGEWGQRWARAQVGRGDLDPGLPMWDIHRRVNLEALPPKRVVVRVDFRGVPATMRCPRTWWLVLERREVDLCLKDPGFLVDIVVSADLRTLTRVWMGDVRLAETVRAGLIRFDGRRRSFAPSRPGSHGAHSPASSASGPRSPPAQHSDPLEASSPVALGQITERRDRTT
jgi:DNA-binding HxlR family transcriptional regulator